MDLIVKYLNNIPFGQVLFMRFFFGMIPIFFLIPRNKIFTFYKTKRPILHTFRAVSGTIAIIALFIALRNLPLADVISLTFTGPLFVTIMSVIFLSEKVGIRRWSAVAIGFIGMLFIVRPAFEEMNFYYIFPVIFSLGFANVAISIRSLSKTEPNYLIAFYFSLLSLFVGLLTIVNGWIWPTTYEAFLFLLLGLAGGVANLLLTQSYRLADASLVSPIKYLSLVVAVGAGYFIFSETPKAMTLFGASLIVVSSFIIFRREEKLKKQVVAPRV
tara:strand:- start:5077 stop:5892 length:816 start_codon:yes stop_codon:yes gene_type:complete